MQYILAIDQGTSSTRAMLFSVDGKLINSCQYPINVFRPQSLWVEQDPEEIWRKTVKAIKNVVSHVDINQIITCGITNQRETTVVWDKQTGECIGPAIVWQDKRTADTCNKYLEHKEIIQNKTGLVLDPYFSATKLQWILRHRNQARELASQEKLAFGTIDSYLIWRLNEDKRHLTDITNASRTMLYNINDKKWDKELLELFDIPFSVLPEVRSCDAHYGFLDKGIIGRKIPINAVLGDQHASLFGQSCFHKGMIKATFGTGGFVMMNTGDKVMNSKHNLISTIAFEVNNKTSYALEGNIYHAGTTIKWLRDGMEIIKKASETEALAASLSSNEGLYLISAFNGLGAPYWTNKSGALMTGISLSCTKAHFARAALEGVCYQVNDLLSCIAEDSNIQIDTLRVDGGMADNNWFLQFMADQCDILVQKPIHTETTAYGTAMLAAIGAKVYSDLHELEKIWKIDKEYIVKMSDETRKTNQSGWNNALNMLLHK